MNRTVNSLVEKAVSDRLSPDINLYIQRAGLKLSSETNAENNEVSAKDVISAIRKAEETIYSEFTGRNYKGEATNKLGLKVNETLQTSDASIVFKRVISNILQEPKEPYLYLTQLAEKIVLPEDSPIVIEFPIVSSLSANWLDEGQNYPAEVMAFGQGRVSMRIGKAGLTTSFTEEMLRHAQWGLMDLGVRSLSNAINRLVEERLFQTLTGLAQVFFDNTVVDNGTETSGNARNTAGKGRDGKTSNGTLSYYDIMKMMGVVLGRKYQPTHFITHPLAWPILAQDPIMHAAFFTGGQIGQGIWQRNPTFDQQVNMPFNMQYVPYYAIPFIEGNTLTGPFSGQAACTTVDAYVIDGANSLYLATRGEMEMEDHEEWIRDALTLKARLFAGVSAKDQGKPMLRAANLRIDRNYEPLFATQTVTV